MPHFFDKNIFELTDNPLDDPNFGGTFADKLQLGEEKKEDKISLSDCLMLQLFKSDKQIRFVFNSEHPDIKSKNTPLLFTDNGEKQLFGGVNINKYSPVVLNDEFKCAIDYGNQNMVINFRKDRTKNNILAAHGTPNESMVDSIVSALRITDNTDKDYLKFLTGYDIEKDPKWARKIPIIESVKYNLRTNSPFKIETVLPDFRNYLTIEKFSPQGLAAQLFLVFFQRLIRVYHRNNAGQIIPKKGDNNKDVFHYPKKIILTHPADGKSISRIRNAFRMTMEKLVGFQKAKDIEINTLDEPSAAVLFFINRIAQCFSLGAAENKIETIREALNLKNPPDVNNNEFNVLLCDMGHGTTDFCIMKIEWDNQNDEIKYTKRTDFCVSRGGKTIRNKIFNNIRNYINENLSEDNKIHFEQIIGQDTKASLYHILTSKFIYEIYYNKDEEDDENIKCKEIMTRFFKNGIWPDEGDLEGVLNDEGKIEEFKNSVLSKIDEIIEDELSGIFDIPLHYYLSPEKSNEYWIDLIIFVGQNFKNDGVNKIMKRKMSLYKDAVLNYKDKVQIEQIHLDMNYKEPPKNFAEFVSKNLKACVSKGAYIAGTIAPAIYSSGFKELPYTLKTNLTGEESDNVLRVLGKGAEAKDIEEQFANSILLKDRFSKYPKLILNLLRRITEFPLIGKKIKSVIEYKIDENTKYFDPFEITIDNLNEIKENLDKTYSIYKYHEISEIEPHNSKYTAYNGDLISLQLGNRFDKYKNKRLPVKIYYSNKNEFLLVDNNDCVVAVEEDIKTFKGGEFIRRIDLEIEE